MGSFAGVSSELQGLGLPQGFGNMQTAVARTLPHVSKYSGFCRLQQSARISNVSVVNCSMFSALMFG